MAAVSPPLKSEFSDADDSVGLMLWRVTNRWQAAQRAALRPFGLTHVQFVLLASLTWLQGDEPITQRQLSIHAGADEMMVSQVLRALEKKALIERPPHPTDARARAVLATPLGAKLASKANAAVEAVDRKYFSPLHGERTAFARLLRQLHGG
jgi:DNA-binding MarR family transcriptional regulator